LDDNRYCFGAAQQLLDFASVRPAAEVALKRRYKVLVKVRLKPPQSIFSE
jgi:hypothetical protein